MDPVIASLLGTVIGGFFGIVGGILTGRRQAKLEKEKWLQTREDDIAKETRLALAETTKKLGAAVQAMFWLTGKVATYPPNLTKQDILNYNNEIQRLLPDILGSLMVVSALDTELSERMEALAAEIYRLDGELDNASKSFEESPESSIKELLALHSEVFELQKQLTRGISGISGLTGVGRNLAKSARPNE